SAAYNENSGSYNASGAATPTDYVMRVSSNAADSQLATADPHLLELCRDEGIDVIPLPDSLGRTWSP
ncbi:MAG TPA: hypothetical protein VGH31_11300, partial [Acidimicrobiales bacterium]